VTEPTRFETWAIVEVMGHTRLAGRVSEQAVGGCNFVRVDVPELDVPESRYTEATTIPAFTKLLGQASIFSITPCDEQTARRAAASFQTVPFATFVAPEVARLPAPVTGYTTDDDPEDY
jgi:hypothetical protein